MKDKKVIALAVLLVLAVMSIFHGLTASPKGKARKAVKPVASDSAMLGAGQDTAAQGAAVMKRRAKRSEFTSWKRSPFGSSGVVASSELSLNGIMWNSVNPSAMVGDSIVKKGDKIGNNTVVEIRPDAVVLNDGTKDIELKLKK